MANLFAINPPSANDQKTVPAVSNNIKSPLAQSLFEGVIKKFITDTITGMIFLRPIRSNTAGCTHVFESIRTGSNCTEQNCGKLISNSVIDTTMLALVNTCLTSNPEWKNDQFMGYEVIIAAIKTNESSFQSLLDKHPLLLNFLQRNPILLPQQTLLEIIAEHGYLTSMKLLVENNLYITRDFLNKLLFAAARNIDENADQKNITKAIALLAAPIIEINAEHAPNNESATQIAERKKNHALARCLRLADVIDDLLKIKLEEKNEAQLKIIALKLQPIEMLAPHLIEKVWLAMTMLRPKNLQRQAAMVVDAYFKTTFAKEISPSHKQNAAADDKHPVSALENLDFLTTYFIQKRIDAELRPTLQPPKLYRFNSNESVVSASPSSSAASSAAPTPSAEAANPNLATGIPMSSSPSTPANNKK